MRASKKAGPVPPPELEDLFDLEEIQAIQDQFAKANGVASLITRPDGTPLTKPSNFNRLCTEMIRKTGRGLKNCRRSDAALGKGDSSGPTIQPCLSAGFWNGGAAVSVNGRHIANWLVGQIRGEKQSDGKMMAYAREIGADEKEFRKALAEVRRMPLSQFRGICRTLFLFANQLSRAAYQNYRQLQLLAERKQTRAESGRLMRVIEQTNSSLAALQANIPGVVYRTEYSGRKLKAAFLSEHVGKITGYPPGEYLEGRRSCLDAIHPEDRAATLGAILAAVREGKEEYAVSYRVVHRSGEIRWVSDRARILRGKKAGSFACEGVFIDITREKAAEDELRFANLLSQIQSEASLDGILVVDEAGKIISFNKRFTEIWGIPPDVIASRADGLVLESVLGGLVNPEEFLGRVKALYANRTAVSREEIALLDGRTLDRYSTPMVSGEGRYYGRVWHFRDITGHKRANSALREAFEMQGALNAMLRSSMANITVQEKLSSHLANLFLLPWLAVAPKGAVFLMDPGGKALVLTAQQGLSPFLRKACARVPLGRCLCGRAAESGRAVEAAEVGADHHITYAGMEPHGHCCAPIIAGGKTLGVLNLYLKAGTSLTGEQTLFIKHVTDIMAENILHAQTEKELLHAQKMESVGRLAGGVAHDFNNILTAIKCYAGFILKGLAPQDPKTGDAQEILKAADRAVSLTRQLLAFSRRQVITPKATDLNECVAGIANMLRHLVGEDIVFTVKPASKPCRALLDTGQIEQVLVNLVVNARDAMPGGGIIELSTEILPRSGDRPPARQGPPLVCIKVKDSGCGMTQEVKSHLFEPFYTTKEQGKGTGLGLSTVFGIVKQSGGEIKVESETGKGTLFSIYFPYCEAAPAAADENSVNLAGGAKGRETVLLVEDEESLLRLGKRILAAKGYAVLTAADGPGALKEIERHGRPVDLLLTDLVMPGMSGRELALEITRRAMAGRTIYMSGYTDDAIIKHGILEPGIAFIYKPFTAETLSLKLREVLDGPADQARA